jgi:hypothetical protein
MKLRKDVFSVCTLTGELMNAWGEVIGEIKENGEVEYYEG